MQFVRGEEVEYKEALTIQTEDQKQEFLNNVSSFANADGGYLIYGIRENKQDAGMPVEVCGLKGDNPGRKTVDMENIIFTGIEPRLRGVTIFPVLLPSHENRTAIILHIPKSFAAPHMVKSSGRFYSRNSIGKFPLDVAQLRNAFELGGTIAERIKSFRVERLGKISAGEETPVPLDEHEPKIVLHMIPFNAFATSETFDLKPLYDGIKGQLYHPLTVWDDITNGYIRFNIDGLVRYIQWKTPLSPSAYTQIFRNGVIETVDMSLLGINAFNVNNFHSNVVPTSFSGERYERRLLECIKRFIEVQKFLGVDQPFFLMVSLLNVNGYRIGYGQLEYTDVIDRNNLIIPEIIIEDFDTDLAAAIKPIFDTVWNAVGAIGSPNYDTEGKFKFWY